MGWILNLYPGSCRDWIWNQESNPDRAEKMYFDSCEHLRFKTAPSYSGFLCSAGLGRFAEGGPSLAQDQLHVHRSGTSAGWGGVNGLEQNWGGQFHLFMAKTHKEIFLALLSAFAVNAFRL
jgi:hypothetical protein